MRRGFFLLFAVLLVMTSGISEIAAFESVQGPSYRSYFYNYPHTVPPDYVFRTERVFASPSRGLGIFNPVSETIK